MNYGIGFLGQGNFHYKTNPVLYRTWHDMLRRCYCLKFQDNYPTYIGCSVDERWYNFQNFCSDYLRMSGHSQNWDLDKDLLFKGNKIYSNETCCLIPDKINSLILKANSRRGQLPIGVSFSNRKINPYKAYCRINSIGTDLGNHKTLELAFQAYKEAKELEIKRVANLYKFQLDPRAYKALINYKVEIDD